MSKPRFRWWGYVKGMVRDYPSLVERYAGQPGTRQREYEAVRRAVEATARYPNGRERLKVIRLVLWEQGHTLEGAALQVPCHYKTAQGWHSDFIRLTASFYGLMDGEGDSTGAKKQA